MTLVEAPNEDMREDDGLEYSTLGIMESIYLLFLVDIIDVHWGWGLTDHSRNLESYRLS